MRTVHYILLAVVLAVVGQVCIKRGLNLLGNLSFSKQFVLTYLKILSSPYVVFGIMSHVLSVFFWLYCLSKEDLSFAYPFVALSYVLVMFSSKFLLGESIPLIRWAGVWVISFGVVLVSRS